MPNARRNVPFAAAIESIRCSPRAVSTSATTGTPGRRRAVSFTWSVDSTIASTTPARPPSATGPPRCAGRASASAATSSSHHFEPYPFRRTQPVWPEVSQASASARARSLSLGATASSMSRMTMSAAESSAGWNRSGWAALTSSQERASSGSMRWPGTAWNAGEGVIAAGRVMVMKGLLHGAGAGAGLSHRGEQGTAIRAGTGGVGTCGPRAGCLARRTTGGRTRWAQQERRGMDAEGRRGCAALPGTVHAPVRHVTFRRRNRPALGPRRRKVHRGAALVPTRPVPARRG